MIRTSMPNGIDTYRAKRRFADTPEPRGGAGGAGDALFVIQKHHARRLHHHPRLQIRDAPKSWARPLADYDVLVEAPNSVVTGRPVDEEPPEPRKPVRRKPAAKIAGAVAAPMPSRWRPQLAGSADAAPRGKGWLHEIKYDGYRTL